MRVAVGSDRRGARVAKRFVADVLFRDHYANLADDAPKADEELVGAYMIEGVEVADVYSPSEEAKIYPIRYRGAAAVETDDAPNVPNAAASNDADESDAAPAVVDYPDVAAAVAEAVSLGRAERGILICGTGIGMCVAANKFRGVRAAACYNEAAAELSRRHNDANVLCLSGEFLGLPALESLLRVWLTTPFDGGRHARRVDRVSELERETGL